MKVQKLEICDIEQVTELYKELVPFECDTNQFIDNFYKIQNNQDYYIIVVKQNDIILGTATAICCHALDCNFLVVENVVVREELRGKGVGKAIFNEIDNFARIRSCNYSILVSSGFRRSAHKFYERMGYEEDVRGFRKCY